MTTWLKTNLAAVLAIMVSLSAVGISSIKLNTADSTQINLRVSAIEKQVEPLNGQINEIQVQMGVVAETISNNNDGLKDLTSRTRSLETTTAVNNVVLTKLTDAVTELTQSTKQLTKTMTAVAVLDNKVENLTKAINDKAKD